MPEAIFLSVGKCWHEPALLVHQLMHHTSHWSMPGIMQSQPRMPIKSLSH